VSPLRGCHPTPFYLSDLVSPLFFVNLPTKNFSFGCHPLDHPGRSVPLHPPSDATENVFDGELAIGMSSPEKCIFAQCCLWPLSLNPRPWMCQHVDLVLSFIEIISMRSGDRWENTSQSGYLTMVSLWSFDLIIQSVHSWHVPSCTEVMKLWIWWNFTSGLWDIVSTNLVYAWSFMSMHARVLRGLERNSNYIDIYRVAQKWHSFLYALTSSNINRFSKLFHCQNQEKWWDL